MTKPHQYPYSSLPFSTCCPVAYQACCFPLPTFVLVFLFDLRTRFQHIHTCVARDCYLHLGPAVSVSLWAVRPGIVYVVFVQKLLFVVSHSQNLQQYLLCSRTQIRS
jgi:hypothetical protein